MSIDTRYGRFLPLHNENLELVKQVAVWNEKLYVLVYERKDITDKPIAEIAELISNTVDLDNIAVMPC